MTRCALLLVALVIAPSRAVAADEPGMDDLLDEPGILERVVASPPRGPILRIDIAFGLSSLLDDPDVGTGYGGGIAAVLYGTSHRFGAELSVFVASNPYRGALGELGGFSSFIAGNIALGPNLELMRPGSRLSITAELLLGAYVIAPPVPVQDLVWTLGLAGGMTLSYRVTGWLGVGLKVRYHLFNVAKIAGADLVDRKAFEELGVVDRFEVPGYVSFCF